MTNPLLDRARAGDRDALEQLVRDNSEWLQRQIRRRLDGALREECESRDVVHDAVLQLLESDAVSTLRDEEHLRALLQKIAQGDLIDRHRRRANRRLDPQEFVQRRPDPTRPSQHARRIERRELVRRALDTLGHEDQAMLTARVWEQRSFTEIALALGCTEDAARMRCNRALARFADAAERLLGGGTVDLGLSR